jgi:hypothetical protein
VCVWVQMRTGGGRGPQIDKNLPQSPFTSNFFYDHILLLCLYSFSIYSPLGGSYSYESKVSVYVFTYFFIPW